MRCCKSSSARIALAGGKEREKSSSSLRIITHIWSVDSIQLDAINFNGIRFHCERNSFNRIQSNYQTSKEIFNICN